jgi:Domain of unknown function (4846)
MLSTITVLRTTCLALALLLACPTLATANTYPWQKDERNARTIASEVPVPDEYKRVECKAGRFGDWLRHLPLKPKGAPVLLHNGGRKNRQDMHVAVIDMDTGKRDLQQCADAVMRLRAEYLYSKQNFSAIHFNFTSGDRASFTQWAAGYRPVVEGSTVQWTKRSGKDRSYASFRSYLDTVFIYAGSHSLSKELAARKDPRQIQVGDIYIQGGFPGHAVLVVDVVEHRQSGERIFLLAQSYMPAQEVHVLKNPEDGGLSPWHKTPAGEVLRTPQWTFRKTDLKCFPNERRESKPSAQEE